MPWAKTHLGELLAFVAALVWAVSVILFKKSGERVHPIALNLFKDLMALALFVPTIYLTGGTLFWAAPPPDYGWLLLSGVLGIGLGDTLFFASLNRLGAGLTAIVVCMYTPFIVGLSALYLHEQLSWWQLAGATFITTAVLVAGVIGKNAGNRKDLWVGVALGTAAQASTAIGIVGIKPLLATSPLLWAAEVRLVGGVAALVLILLFHKGRRAIIESLRSTGRFAYTLTGSFVGAYVAMIVWIGGMKYAKASVAAALNQTSNVFVFVLAAIFLKEAITTRRTAALAMAVAGALMVTFL